MKIYNNILEIIGNTPIVRLNKIPGGKANIYAKLEFLNPSGSIKDRAAFYIINKEEKEGKINWIIVENSSGNMGISLAMIGAVKGYRIIITTPDKISQDKISIMKAYGADVILTKTNVSPDSPESYHSVAKKIANEFNAYHPDQYNNPLNVEAHYKITGPEIWEQMEGKIDVFVAGIGTGGTITGIGKFLKEKNPEIKVIGVDPEGSILFDIFKGNTVKNHPYMLEGIGQESLNKNIDFTIIDDIIKVDDKESFMMARRIASEEGIFVGGSSGAAMVAAMKMADLYKDKNILVIFPDSGDRYLTKIFNDEWMIKNGFMEEE